MQKSAAEPDWLAALGRPEAWPEDASSAAGIERIDTHISYLMLTGERVYKLRRAVRLSFLDFTDPAERLADALREIRLNRRLAPDVYLGLAPILHKASGASADAKARGASADAKSRGAAADGTSGRVIVGPAAESESREGDVLEHCVVMRRLKAGRDLKSMLERGDTRPEHIDRIARRMAGFHREHSLGRPSPYGEPEWLARTTAPARANLDTLAEVPASLAPPERVAEARRLAAAFVDARRADFDSRLIDGRVVDGHGDLHTEHVWFEHDDAEPLMIDCLEFRDDFRFIDAASDVAFLAMDLCYRGRADLSSLFLRRYARASGDYHLFAVIDYFLSYRALVRAKVAALVATDESLALAQRRGAAESVQRHLDLGLSFLKPRGLGRVVLACGTIGTGKTTVAEELADRCGGVVVSSDRVRRSLGAAVAGRYTDASRSAVYERLLAEAAPVVSSGRTAILDATYSRRAWRDAAARWASEHAADCSLVEVVAERDEVMERLAGRAAAGNDASEAGPGLYDTIRAEFEEPSEWLQRFRVDTSSARWREQVAEIASMDSQCCGPGRDD